MKLKIVSFIFILLIVLSSEPAKTWGFFGHKKINEIAIYTLPVEMSGFYKKHIHLMVEKSVAPDKRRYIDPSEAPRHYIDIDHYGDSAIYKMPRNWYDAVEKYTEDTLKEYGIVPWHILFLKKQLTEAFLNRDYDRILRVSSDIGHYIGDANVPLHTTENYNGQLSGQYGIHGLWESRLPELFYDDYKLFTGQAIYLENPSEVVWEHVMNAHLALDSVLSFEKITTSEISENQKYSFEKRGKMTTRVYSRKFSTHYHKLLNGMVERQMKRAIRLLGNIWFTCWVDAGQPDLNNLNQNSLIQEDTLVNGNFQVTRPHE